MATLTLQSGVIDMVKADKKFGFIKPDGALPPGYANNSVFFNLYSVKPFGCTLSRGQKVIFELSSKHLEKPFANAVFIENAKAVAQDRKKLKPTLRSVVLETKEKEVQDKEELKSATKHSQIKSDLEKSNIKFSEKNYYGQICTIKEKFGFLNIEGNNTSQCKDVYFSVSKVQSGLIPLKIGDTIEFFLSQSKTNKPKATNCKLIRCELRCNEEIAEYLKLIEEIVKDNESLDISIESTYNSENIEENGNLFLDSNDNIKTQENDSLNTVKNSENDIEIEEIVNTEGRLISLMSSMASWEAIGNSNLNEDLIKDLIILILKLDTVCNTLKTSFHNVLKCLLNTPLFHPKHGALKSVINLYYSTRIEWKNKLESFILLLLETVPENSKKVVNLSMYLLSDDEAKESIFYKMLCLLTRTSSDNVDLDWNALPLKPTPDEFKNCNTNFMLKCVKRKGPYISGYDYMDTYFRLLRADCFDKMLKSLEDIRKCTFDIRDMNLYLRCEIVGIIPVRQSGNIGLAFKVNPYRNVNDWKASKCLTFGNLLCISSSGNFSDPLWATVFLRDSDLLNNKSIVVVELCTELNTITDADVFLNLLKNNRHIAIAESPSYYRAYQPVLKSLQNLNSDNLPFTSEIVFGRSSCEPDYLASMNSVMIDPSCIIEESPKCSVKQLVDLLNQPNTRTKLDNSQRIAITRCLENRVAIIQGPPGTGKTFIGSKLVELLLSISNEHKPNGPILLLTYKNHALDEFLKSLVSKFPDRMARIGGRSQEPLLNKINYSEIKKSYRMDASYFAMYIPLRIDVCILEEKMLRIAEKVHDSHIFRADDFVKFLKKNQICHLLLHGSLFTIQKKNHIKNLLEDLIEVDNLGDYIISTDLLKYSLKLTYDEMIEHRDELKKYFLTAYNKWKPPNDVISNFENLFSSDVSHYLPTIHNFQEIEEETVEVENEEAERLAATDNNLRAGNINFFKSNASDINLISNSAEIETSCLTSGVLNTENLWNIPMLGRYKLIQYIMHKSVLYELEDLKNIISEYKNKCCRKKEIENMHKASILRSMRIIGMTVTGASIHSDLLARVKPPIVLVEEAAEILEPQLMSNLGPWLKHLILIGDHQQLRPKVESFELVREYNFDISMMERLVNNGLSHGLLEHQNRMRPEFAELLLDIYPNLKSNLERVNKNTAPSCIRESMYFWSHCEKEIHGRSFKNVYEAKAVVGLTHFLLENGYKPNQITVLSCYQGQVSLLRREIRKLEQKFPYLFYGKEEINDNNSKILSEERKITIQTIDYFQGDENDIIIVSLVRSNNEDKIGFLAARNRRCVAQSRSRCGLYFIGNSDLLMSNIHWKNLIEIMKKRNCVGPAIPLCCKFHPNSVLEAGSPESIQLSFCREACIEMMKCGEHRCPELCHPEHKHSQCMIKTVHKYINCRHITVIDCFQKDNPPRCIKTCEHIMVCKVHNCKMKCGDTHEHSFCKEITTFTFSTCGHLGKKECSAQEDLCEKKVEFIFSKCQHSATKKCWEKEDKKSCKALCERKRSCNHPCTSLCGELCEIIECDVCTEEKIVDERKKREQQKILRKIYLTEVEEMLNKMAKEKPEFSRIELSSTGDTAEEYLSVEDRVKKYVQPGHNWFPSVIKIEKIRNTSLYKDWLKCKKLMKDPERSELKFHGTSAEAVEIIIRTGFVLPQKNGMYGKGIYFATDSSKSAQEMYTKGSNLLLLCDVLLGKSMVVDKAFPDMDELCLQTKGYDSLFAKRGTKSSGGVFYDEFVVYEIKQALPKYIIHYSKNQLTFDNLPKQRLPLQMTTTKIKAKRGLSVGDPLDMHYRTAESQFLRLCSQRRLNYNIIDVDYIENPKLINAFNSMKSHMKTLYPGQKDADPVLAFHGTNVKNIDLITKENFKLDKIQRGAYGWGIYFSEFPDISIGYSSGANKLLLCYVLPGKSYNSSSVYPSNLAQGYDSHIVGSDSEGLGEMIVIFNPDQILPCYVINYSS